MTGPDQVPPDGDATLGTPAAPRTPGAEAGGASPAGRVPPGHQRTHPITPLVTGWRIILGVLAVLTAQNVARLVQDFTPSRLLIGLGVIAAVMVLGVGVAALSWWATSYGVDDDGVTRQSGLLSRSRQFAPRSRIESVSVERPLVARLLGLAKVRVEIAGGDESHLDIAYIRAQDAEALRRRILRVAAGEGDGGTDLATDDGAGAAPVAGADGERGPAAGPEHAAQVPSTAQAGLREVLRDGVTDGEPIAEIPTARLVRSLLRDLGFLLGFVMSVVGVGLAIGLAVWQDGLSLAILVPLLPALVAIPRYVFGRIEAGWGFVSRITDRGLRMRRGLATTRTDNIAAGRIQRLDLRRPLLWRTPRWTAVHVTVAGIEDDSENGAQNALPVGTDPELALTLGHLAPPLGTADDLAFVDRWLSVPARQLDGWRVPHPLQWIARRTQATTLLPGALVHRSGVLTRRLQVIPRDRIQQVSLHADPLGRRIGVMGLKVGVAGHTVSLDDLPEREARLLHTVLSEDAARLRRYRDRAHWPRPALAVGAPVPAAPGGIAAPPAEARP